MTYSTRGQSRRELRVLARIDRRNERQRRRVLKDVEARRKYERADADERDARDLDRADLIVTGVLTLGLAPLFGVLFGVERTLRNVSEESRKVRPTPVRVVNRW